MSDFRIKFNLKGFRDLRSAPGVRTDLEARAKRVQAAAEAMDGGNYGIYSQQGEAKPQGRWRTSVFTADPKTMALNAKHHTLLKALEDGK